MMPNKPDLGDDRFSDEDMPETEHPTAAPQDDPELAADVTQNESSSDARPDETERIYNLGNNSPVELPDFIAAIGPHHGLAEHHRMLLANCLAQGEALMRGRTLAEAGAELAAAGATPEEQQRLAPHMVCPGNQPSNTILMRRLDPRSLGALLALYEHKVFVQAVLWRINPFDQYGVELGKKLATGILQELEVGAPSGTRDSSTNGLIGRCLGRA